MNWFRFRLSAGMFGASLCLAQTVVPQPYMPFVFSDLKAYFDFSPTQILAISHANDDYRQAVSNNQQRIFQVQFEIDQEIRKDPLDPMALGIRYVEIEQLRRQSNEEFAKTRDKVRGVLTDAQKAKLKTLEDARKLQPLISQAECQNLLDPITQEFASFILGVAVNVLPQNSCPSVPGLRA